MVSAQMQPYFRFRKIKRYFMLQFPCNLHTLQLVFTLLFAHNMYYISRKYIHQLEKFLHDNICIVLGTFIYTYI